MPPTTTGNWPAKADHLHTAILPASAADFAALVDGKAPEGLRLPGGDPVEAPEVLAMLAGLASKVSAYFTPAAWLILDGDEIVGLASLVRMPHDRGIDIGYGIAPNRRGRGHASRAVADLLAWARKEPRIDIVRAETSTANPASQAVLSRNGFVETGRRHDREDGDLVCWQADVRG